MKQRPKYTIDDILLYGALCFCLGFGVAVVLAYFDLPKPPFCN
jgi:hypothetical protein